jgi:hypothetical protein
MIDAGSLFPKPPGIKLSVATDFYEPIFLYVFAVPHRIDATLLSIDRLVAGRPFVCLRPGTANTTTSNRRRTSGKRFTIADRPRLADSGIDPTTYRFC